MKWVTPRTYRLRRDVGLLGYDADGQPDPSWRGRNDGRGRRRAGSARGRGGGPVARPIITAMAAAAIRVAVFGKG